MNPLVLSSPLRLLLLVGLVCAVVIILYYGVWTNTPLPDHHLLQGLNDLFLHLAAFAALAFLSLFLWQQFSAVIVVLFLGGCAIEFLQLINPRRNVSLVDLAGNMAGILLGVFVYLVVHFVLTKLFAWQKRKNAS